MLNKFSKNLFVLKVLAYRLTDMVLINSGVPFRFKDFFVYLIMSYPSNRTPIAFNLIIVID